MTEDTSPEIDKLIEKLNSDDYAVCEAAACALGNIGDELAVEPLIKALEDEVGDVRCYAAEALGKIGDARAVEPLIKIVESSDEVDWDESKHGSGPNSSQSWFFSSAARALERIGDTRALGALTYALSPHHGPVDWSDPYTGGSDYSRWFTWDAAKALTGILLRHFAKNKGWRGDEWYMYREEWGELADSKIPPCKKWCCGRMYSKGQDKCTNCENELDLTYGVVADALESSLIWLIKIEENDGWGFEAMYESSSDYSESDLYKLLKELYLCLYNKKLNKKILSIMLSDAHLNDVYYQTHI